MKKIKVFLDECVLEMYTIGSLVKALSKTKNGKIKYGRKQLEIENYDEIYKKLLKDFRYKKYTADEVYEVFSRVLHKNKKYLLFYTSEYILHNAIEKIREWLKSYRVGEEALNTVLSNYIEVEKRSRGKLFSFNTGFSNPLKLYTLKLTENEKGDINIMLIDKKYNPRMFRKKKNKLYESATLPEIYLDPADKLHLDTAFYSGADMVLTLDGRMIKGGNCKIHRFVPIILVEEFSKAIQLIKKGKKVVKREFEKSCREKLYKNL